MNAVDDIKAGLPEDPTRELEQRLADIVAGQAREVLSALANAINKDNAQRLLGPMASLVATYNNAIAELRTEFDARPRRRRASTILEAGAAEYAIAGSETFGAQAVQQMVALAKDLLPSVMGQKTSSSSLEIARLTGALVEARASGHMEAVAARIEARLNTLLDCDREASEDEFLDGEGEEVSHADYPLPPVMVGGFPVGGEGAHDLDADGDGPDASGGGEAVEVPGEDTEEALGL